MYKGKVISPENKYRIVKCARCGKRFARLKSRKQWVGKREFHNRECFYAYWFPKGESEKRKGFKTASRISRENLRFIFGAVCLGRDKDPERKLGNHIQKQATSPFREPKSHAVQGNTLLHAEIPPRLQTGTYAS